MKFFRLDLLTLLISLFILNSCKNQDTIGLGVNSQTQVNGIMVDTSTIVVNTVLEDSVVTSGLTKAPLGYFQDPIFGTTESSLAASLSLPGATGYSLPSGTISIDSTRLVLHYVDGFYGDSVASNYKVNVYQLDEPYGVNTGYYASKVWKVNPSLLGTTNTFKVRPHDSIKITNIIKGKPDSLIKVPTQIRVPIDNNFIITNLFHASSATLGSNSVFQNAVKGLYITLDKTGTTGSGGTIMLSNADSVNVYCKISNNGVIDTTTIKLPISQVAASIKRTYTPTIKAELDNATSGNVFYLQGLAGLRTKISFPNLLSNLRKGLASTGNDIVLNRAELVVTPAPGSYTQFRPLPKITMYRLDIAHQRILLQDASPSDSRSQGVGSFGGFYNSKTSQYHFIITAFLQDLLLKKTVDYGTYIAPVDTLNKSGVDYTVTPSIAARTVAVGSDNTSQYRIKLNIIYTKIKK